MNQVQHSSPSARIARPYRLALWLPGLALIATLSGCRAIGDIFKVGVGVGVFVVVVIVAVIAGIVGFVRRG